MPIAEYTRPLREAFDFVGDNLSPNKLPERDHVTFSECEQQVLHFVLYATTGAEAVPRHHEIKRLQISYYETLVEAFDMLNGQIRGFKFDTKLLDNPNPFHQARLYFLDIDINRHAQYIDNVEPQLAHARSQLLKLKEQRKALTEAANGKDSA